MVTQYINFQAFGGKRRAVLLFGLTQLTLVMNELFDGVLYIVVKMSGKITVIWHLALCNLICGY
jgi:hypothetical protein